MVDGILHAVHRLRLIPSSTQTSPHTHTLQSKDKYGKTPLHRVATVSPQGVEQVAEKLLQHGADPLLADDEGATSIRLATRSNGPGVSCAVPDRPPPAV